MDRIPVANPVPNPVPNPIRDEIRALSAYHVANAEGFIKLDAMENPFPLPAELAPGLAEALKGAALNRYPAADAGVLKAALREAMAIPAECEVLLGNGSDEIIQLLALAVAKPGAAILSVEPAFVMFRMIATFAGLRHIGVPLKPDFTLDVDAWIDAIERERPALVFLASPNNPTGNAFAPQDIAATIAATDRSGSLLVIDEAYYPFADHHFMDQIAAHPNVLLMRTVSKLGLAGLRLGFLTGHRRWLDELDKLRLPYNINVLTQAAAAFALRHYDAFLAQARHIVAERERLGTALEAMPQVTRFPSQANFILVRVPDSTSAFAALTKARILVKHTGPSHPLLANTLRLTVGTPAENDALLAALSTFLRPA